LGVTPPATLEQAIEVIDGLARQLHGLTRENQLLRERLRALLHRHFGRGQETLSPGQLALFEDLPSEPEAVTTPPPTPPSCSRRNGHGRASFPDHLPREIIESDLAADQRGCPECGQEMRAIGEDVSERGHLIPARIVVHRYVRRKYACPAGHAVKTAPLPDGVIAKGKYEASVYAYVATAKYADHLPLHRLEGIFKRHGLKLSKQTMWDLLTTVDELVAQPILDRMREELLAEPVLHADETPIPMRLEEGAGQQTVFAWGWRNLRESGESKVLIDFRQGRGRDGPIRFLGKWSGTLLTDGYSGYDEVIRRNGIVRAGCLAHARRKAREALEVGARRAVELLRPLQRLFWIERAVRDRAARKNLDYEGLLALRGRVRERRSRVVWDQLGAVVEALERDPSTLPKSKLGEAVRYLANQRVAQSAFLRDPRLPIHNNDTERDLRHLAVGRANWTIFGSPRGGAVACRLYSLMLSCKENGVDPQAYLEDLLRRAGTMKSQDLARLTPWGWKAARAKDEIQG